MVEDQVNFNHEGNTITGAVIRVNQKSLSVKTKDGARWYVDPRAGGYENPVAPARE